MKKYFKFRLCSFLQYVTEIKIDGSLYRSRSNSRAQVFSGLKIYLSNADDPPFNGYVKSVIHFQICASFMIYSINFSFLINPFNLLEQSL